MDKQIEQTSTQLDTPKIDWTKNDDAMMWVDVSIRNRELRKIEVAKLCSAEDGKKRLPESWRQHYYDFKVKGFDEYWLSQYKSHFKNKIGAKIYGRMDEVITTEKDLSKLVQVGEFLEGKQAPSVAVQVNNLISEKKDQYGI